MNLCYLERLIYLYMWNLGLFIEKTGLGFGLDCYYLDIDLELDALNIAFLKLLTYTNVFFVGYINPGKTIFCCRLNKHI